MLNANLYFRTSFNLARFKYIARLLGLCWCAFRSANRPAGHPQLSIGKLVWRYHPSRAADSHYLAKDFFLGLLLYVSMASRVAAEMAADALLIGRYFGRSTAASVLSRTAAAASNGAGISRGSVLNEDDGVRLASSSAPSKNMGVGMTAAVGTVDTVRFMSMFSGRRGREMNPADVMANHS